MLYNPNWNRPTIVKFISFLQTMPAKEYYDWMDPRRCACAQFWGGDWIVDNREVVKKEGINLNIIARDGEWTFGALRERLQNALAR